MRLRKSTITEQFGPIFRRRLNTKSTLLNVSLPHMFLADIQGRSDYGEIQEDYEFDSQLTHRLDKKTSTNFSLKLNKFRQQSALNHQRIHQIIDKVDQFMRKRMDAHQTSLISVVRKQIDGMLEDSRKIIDEYNRMIEEKNKQSEIYNLKNQLDYFRTVSLKLFEDSKSIKAKNLMLETQMKQKQSIIENLTLTVQKLTKKYLKRLNFQNKALLSSLNKHDQASNKKIEVLSAKIEKITENKDYYLQKYTKEKKIQDKNVQQLSEFNNVPLISIFEAKTNKKHLLNFSQEKKRAHSKISMKKCENQFHESEQIDSQFHVSMKQSQAEDIQEVEQSKKQFQDKLQQYQEDQYNDQFSQNNLKVQNCPKGKSYYRYLPKRQENSQKFEFKNISENNPFVRTRTMQNIHNQTNSSKTKVKTIEKNQHIEDNKNKVDISDKFKSNTHSNMKFKKQKNIFYYDARDFNRTAERKTKSMLNRGRRRSPTDSVNRFNTQIQQQSDVKNTKKQGCHLRTKDKTKNNNFWRYKSFNYQESQKKISAFT